MTRPLALVTGSSGGIGALYAERLARRGYDLLLVARDAQRLREVAIRVAEAGGASEVLPADLANPADLERVAARLREDDRIDMLVNNAGITGSSPFAGSDAAAIASLLDLNVRALTRLTHAAAGAFVPRHRGTIINIGSVVALMPDAFEPVYVASKAYVLAFSQSLQRELTAAGVRLQVVLPGMTRTDIWRRAGVDPHALPADRMMDAEDLVDAALAGLDLGETVTIPSLADAALWDTANTARESLAPFLSLAKPAARYLE